LDHANEKIPTTFTCGDFLLYFDKATIANQVDKGFSFKKQSDWNILSRFFQSTRPSFLIWFRGNLGAISIETMCTMDKIDAFYRGFSPKFMLSGGFFVSVQAF